MSFDNQDKKTCISNNNDLKKSNGKNIIEFEKIKEYLSSQPTKIKDLNEVSKTLNSIIKSFIEYTKNYSNQIEFLAMKMVPNYTIEGELIQAIQTILLFYSEGLNTLISELRLNSNIKQEEDVNQIIEQFKTQRKFYSQKIKDVNTSYKNFKKEINLYQEFLVNNEYKEHKKKGNLINTDDILINDNKAKVDSDEDNNDKILEKYDENPFLYQLNEIDNSSELIKTNKDYIKSINESNDLLKTIKKFLSVEKTNILKCIYNLCHQFGEGLLNFSKKCNKNFETQNQVLNDLLNNLILNEKNTTLLTDSTIKLKYLEIYSAHKLEKKDLKQEKNTINNDKKSNQDTNSNNKKIRKGKRKSTNTILSMDDANSLKNEITRKTISLSGKQQLFNNYNNRATFNPNNPNQFIDLIEDEKEDIFRAIVEKFNREEIINIFEKIKNTQITLNEEDIQLIEYETNYKKIKEILVLIFINPDKFNNDEKNKLMGLFEKDKKYILYFIKLLNDHRTKGNFFLKEFTLKYLGEIFQYLNNSIIGENNMEIFKYILILSQTYYHNSEKDNKKTFLFSFIKDCPKYSNPKFWDDYLKELIYHELKNGGKEDINLEKIDFENIKKDEKEKLNNCFFSNFITASKVMADFNLDKKFVRELIEKNKGKYHLSQDQIDNICMMYEMSIKEDEINIKNKESKNNLKGIKLDNEDNTTKNSETEKGEMNLPDNNAKDEIKIGEEVEKEKENEKKLSNDKNQIDKNNENNIIINETKKFEIKENEQIDNKPNLNENVSKISDISKNEGKLATNEINNFVEENANNKKENKISNNLEKGIDNINNEDDKK